MKFKAYVKNLNELLEQRPETAELDVITASDDEGNSYNQVYYSPSVGIHSDSEFDVENVEEEQDSINAVCVN
jgi:hypothetical protein